MNVTSGPSHTYTNPKKTKIMNNNTPTPNIYRNIYEKPQHENYFTFIHSFVLLLFSSFCFFLLKIIGSFVAISQWWLFILTTKMLHFVVCGLLFFYAILLMFWGLLIIRPRNVHDFLVCFYDFKSFEILFTNHFTKLLFASSFCCCFCCLNIYSFVFGSSIKN